MLTPLQALGIMVGILISNRLIKKLDDLDNIGKNTKKACLFAFTLIISVLGLSLGIVLLCSGFDKNTGSKNPIVVTIDKLIAGEEVPVQEMRSLLAVTLYPSVKFWVNKKNIPEDRKGYTIKTVAEAIRQATVKIELPPNFLSNVEITGVPLQTQK